MTGFCMHAADGNFDGKFLLHLAKESNIDERFLDTCT